MEHLKLTQKQKQGIYLASGGAHFALAHDIAELMGVRLGNVERKRFANSERYVRYGESVRGSHVFIIQSLGVTDEYSVNDSLVELMLLVDAARRASASEITVVAPYLAYSRQDRKARGREPISAAAVVKALQCMGADRLVSVDMHSAQTQGTFNGPFDHLTAEPLLRAALRQRVRGSHDSYVVVSPDSGRAKIAAEYAEDLQLDVVHMPKSRERGNSSKVIHPSNIPGVQGRRCLLIDDMIDTAGTLVSAAQALKTSGAEHVTVAATHGLFSDPALERLLNGPVDDIIVTDTVPITNARSLLGGKLEVLSCAPVISRALSEIATGGSVSRLFNDHNNR